jgi:hypothetical protein
MLAVAAGPGQLALYAVASGSHAATLVRRLEGPAAMTVESVSLASGSSPAVCAIWRSAANQQAEPTTDLLCYRPGSVRGRLVVRDAGSAALRADGRAVAWTEYTPHSLVVADLTGDVATERRRYAYVEDGEQAGGYPGGIVDLTWVGPRTLAATDDADSDDGRGLCVVDTEAPRPKGSGVGFGRCLHPDPDEGRKGYARFQDAAPVGPGVVATVERAMWCCGDGTDDPGARAVRMRLSDGAVVGVLATPREGRAVVDVSGGSRAVLYTTFADGEPRVVSLRWAHESHGAPVTGLPAGVRLAAAQP